MSDRFDLSELDYEQLVETIATLCIASPVRLPGMTRDNFAAELRRRYPTEDRLRAMWERIRAKLVQIHGAP
jgi:hypothetical protein